MFTYNLLAAEHLCPLVINVECIIKLITSFREIIFRVAAMAARVAQLSIIEALYVNLAIRMKDKAVRNIEKLEKLPKINNARG